MESQDNLTYKQILEKLKAEMDEENGVDFKKVEQCAIDNPDMPVSAIEGLDSGNNDGSGVEPDEAA